MDFTERKQNGFQKVPGERDFRDAARLREALRRFLRESDRITRAWGLTRQRYELLLMVRTARDGSGRAPLQELIDRLQLAQSSVVELVDRAEALGLVARSRGRRQVLVRLTGEGERRLVGAVAELAQHRRRLIELLSGL